MADMTTAVRSHVRRKTVWGRRSVLGFLAALLFACSSIGLAASGGTASGQSSDSRHSRPAPKAQPDTPSSRVKNYKVDDEVGHRRTANPLGTTRVIVTFLPGAKLPSEFRRYAPGAAKGNSGTGNNNNNNNENGNLDIINGQVLELPNWLIKQLEARPEVFRIHYDRPIQQHNYRTSVTVGATTVRDTMGYTGAGVGIAVIDSGIAAWHDDLTKGTTSGIFPYGNQRVAKFVDFVNKQTLPYDDNGHGTHVAGIIAGNGFDSQGEKSGIAPNAKIVSLKVLDGNGRGTISNIIAALNWVAVNYATYNIRVVNLSVGARVTESYWTDPLTLAAKAVVDKGIVVVGASGNFGKNTLGQLQYGAITAPANAPWVLTVGASSTNGTVTRLDDTMAGFSSNGPTYIDFGAKPDLVAPGVGTVSLAAVGSTFYATKSQYLIEAKPKLGFKAYLSLSGTSMAAPVVSGTVALMLQANPTLTPNLVKALLQYTAQRYPGYSALRQGAGFLNSLGAVKLAKFYASNQVGSRMPVQKTWSKEIIWGNHRISHGYINPKGSAWSTKVVWGAAHGLGGDLDNIVWGTECGACDNIVWGTYDADNIVWGTMSLDNIVWGTAFDGDNIVWGTLDADNIVWGTDCGGADCDKIIWGTVDLDNIVWGTALLGDNIVWGTSLLENIVWGTSAEDDSSWASSGESAVMYPDDVVEPLPDPAIEFGDRPLEAPAISPVGGGL
jgi:subtilisin family serine protease